MIPLNRTSSNKPLKNDNEEAEVSPTNNNLITNAALDPSKNREATEFDNDVSPRDNLIDSIFESNTYNHTYESLVEFYSDIYYIMNAKEISDNRNVGTATGIACCGVAGCFTFGLGWIAGIVGVVVGSTVGRCFGNGITKKKKGTKTTQEDLYVAKLNCMIKLAKSKKKKLRHDMNTLRLTIEKIIEEFAPALETSVFQKPKRVNNLLLRLRKVLLGKIFQEALLLSYRLFTAAEERFDMKNKIYLQDASKRFNKVFVPFIKIIEFENKTNLKQTGGANLVAYYRIKSLISNSSKIEQYSQLPGSRPTTEALDKLKEFLQEEVDVKASLMRAMSKENQVTENIELKSPPKSSKSPTRTESPYQYDQIDNDNVIKLSIVSSKDVQSEDVEEIPNSQMVNNMYAFDPPTKKNFNFNDKDVVKFEPIKINTQPRIMIPQGLEESVTESQGPNPNIPKTGEWTVSMKLHQDDLNFCEAAQREVEAQRAALMRVSTQKIQRSPSKKFTWNRRSEEEEKEDGKDDMRSSVHGQRTPKKEKSGLFNAFTPRRLKSGFSSTFKKQKTNKDIPSSSSEESPQKNTEENQENDLMSQNQNFSKAEEMFNRILAIGADYLTKWERVSTNSVITIDKIRPEGSPVVLIRAWAVIRGFTPKEVFDQIFDTEKRAKWETVTMDLKVVEKINEQSQIIYFYVKTPIGISERDFVQIRDYKLDYPQKDHIIMSFKSVNHPKAPPIKGRVRAETHISGYIMKPSEKFPDSTDFCIISQSDIKGNVPKIIVNMASGKAPAEWINKLTKACERSRTSGK